MVVLLGCILIFMSHSLINSFNYQIAMAKGGGSGEMGNAMTISAVSELPTMFLFGYLLKRRAVFSGSASPACFCPEKHRNLPGL